MRFAEHSLHVVPACAASQVHAHMVLAVFDVTAVLKPLQWAALVHFVHVG